MLTTSIIRVIAVPMSMITQLILFREIIAVYSANHNKSINILCAKKIQLRNSKVGGTYIYHRISND
jgi:hypothetical protein